MDFKDKKKLSSGLIQKKKLHDSPGENPTIPISNSLIDEENHQPNVLNKIKFLKLYTEKQSKQLKQHRLEQEQIISLYSKKNEEFSRLSTRLNCVEI